MPAREELEGTGPCQVCGEVHDRRFGVCFGCSDFVKSDGIAAWDVRDPKKWWLLWSDELKDGDQRVKADSTGH